MRPPRRAGADMATAHGHNVFGLLIGAAPGPPGRRKSDDGNGPVRPRKTLRAVHRSIDRSIEPLTQLSLCTHGLFR